MPLEAKREHQISRSRQLWVAWGGCRKVNLGPRQDQYFLLTAEPPPLQGHKIISLLNKVKDKELENLKKKETSERKL